MGGSSSSASRARRPIGPCASEVSGVRGLAGATALVLVLLPAASGAHPGHGLEPVVVDGDSFAYEPATVTVGVGDSLVWTWDGNLFNNHSVTADPGQAEQFDSDPGRLPT